MAAGLHTALPCHNAQGLPILKVDQIERYPVFSARYWF